MALLMHGSAWNLAQFERVLATGHEQFTRILIGHNVPALLVPAYF